VEVHPRARRRTACTAHALRGEDGDGAPEVVAVAVAAEEAEAPKEAALERLAEGLDWEVGVLWGERVAPEEEVGTIETAEDCEAEGEEREDGDRAAVGVTLEVPVDEAPGESVVVGDAVEVREEHGEGVEESEEAADPLAIPEVVP
jgi:hypothetical protein